MRTGRPIKNPQTNDSVRQMLIDGSTPREIKKLFPDLSNQFIAYIRRKCGISPFRPGRMLGQKNKFHKWECKPQRIQQIREWKSTGFTYREISFFLGSSITRQRIQQIISSQPKPGVAACCKCGKITVLHRHHTDYIRDVVENICTGCHRKEHTKNPY